MAAAGKTRAVMEEELPMPLLQDSLQAPQGPPVSNPHTEALSPASTESLIGHTLEDYMLSPMGYAEAYPASSHQAGHTSSDTLINTANLLNKLLELLNRGLSTTAAKITGDIKADLQNLGDRMEVMELKIDSTVARTNQNSDHIHVLQDQLDTALSRIDDLENRS